MNPATPVTPPRHNASGWAQPAGTSGNVLNANAGGTIVGVQTACVVVKHNNDTLRNAKSLMVAARHAEDADDGSPHRRVRPQQGGLKLGYVPAHDAEAIVAVADTASLPELASAVSAFVGPSAAPTNTNPELYFPFHCVVRTEEEDPDDFFHEVIAASHRDGRLKNRGAATDEPEPAYEAPPLVPEADKERCISASIVANALQGINSTLIAIGGSGTGKAERMFHPTDGVVPSTIGLLFDEISAVAAKDKANYRRVNRTVSVSMYEFFAEEISDLLTIPAAAANPSTKNQPAKADGAVVEPLPAVAVEGPPPSLNLDVSNDALSAATSAAPSPSAKPKRTVSFSQNLISFVSSAEPSPAPEQPGFSLDGARFDPSELRAFVAGHGVAPQSTGLRVRFHAELGPLVEGAQELQILSKTDFLTVIRGGIARRVNSAVKTNRFAHVVVKVTVRQAEVGAASAVTADILFVDTATAARVPNTIPSAKKVQQGTNALRKLLSALSDHCAKQPKIAAAALGQPGRGDDVPVPSVKDVLRSRNCSPNVGPSAPHAPAMPNTSIPTATTLLAKDSVFTQYLSDSFFGNTFLTVVGFVLDPESLDDAENLTSAAEEEGAQQTFATLKLVSRAGTIATRVTPNFVAVSTKATAIKDEIDALKRELEADAAAGGATNEENIAKLQAYEEQLSNLQSAFEERAATHAELESECARQRQALLAVQEQLQSRRQQAEELEAFADELDRLLEEHRANERRLRREMQLAQDRENEAKRLRHELARLEAETDDLRAEQVRVDRARVEQRQLNIAAFFRSLLEHQQRKRDIDAMAAANRQLKTRCAVMQVKLDKTERQRQAVVDDIESSKAVHTVLLKQQYDLEHDKSDEVCDRQISQVVELTQRLQSKVAYTRADIKDVDATLATARKALQDVQSSAALTIRTETEALSEMLTRRQHTSKAIDDENQLVGRLAAQIGDRNAHIASLAKVIVEREQIIDSLDAERRSHSESAVTTRAERDAVQEEVLALTVKLEALQEELEAHRALHRTAEKRYFDLCDSAAGRLATSAAPAAAASS